MKKPNLTLFLLLAAALGGAVFTVWWMGGGTLPAPQSEVAGRVPDMSELGKEIEGAVVYEHRGGIYKTVIGGKEGVLLAGKGTYPRWSPDGRHVAFLRDGNLLRMNAEGGEVEVLLAVKDPRALAYHPNNREILFTDGKKVKSYTLEGKKVRPVVEGLRCFEIDVSADGARLVATAKRTGFRIYAFNLHTGKKRKLAAGCSASISPDGRIVTRNDRSHTRLSLLSWEKGEEAGSLSAPDGLLFDNQFWSNDQDWIVSRSEGAYQDIFVHRVSTDEAYRATYSGDCDRPDFFVRSR
jgi:Tol biopolymer transport system component